MKVKKLSKENGEKLEIDSFPNFHKSGSIIGMKKKFYGEKALLVRCGNFIYNVSSKPEIYNDYAE
jgi:hypothetical protein